MTRTRRRALAAVIGLTTAVSLGVVVAGPAEAASTHIVRPGESIQAAVDAANPGDTIRVLRGTYVESVSITTSDISLVGSRATLQSPGDPLCGVCVGDFNDPSNTVTGVSVSGFTVTGFEFGIFAFAADQTSIRNNILEDNAEYGVFANSSTNTTIMNNTATGSSEAGFYVGDSAAANATVSGNEASGALFGVFVRHAEGGTVTSNRLHDNCVGVLVLADAPGPAGDFDISHNRISHNTKVCDEEPPAVSGVGVAVVGAHDVTISNNNIRDNLPGGPVDLTGGVLVIGGFGGTAPVDNAITNNVIRNNAPDIVLGPEAESTTVVSNNSCETSQPSGLCDN